MSDIVVPIRASDKLQTLFDRDERLIDVIASHSPQLATLRHSPMRRIMARVTTVAQAARLCNVPTDLLVHDLNVVLGVDSDEDVAADIEDVAIQQSDDNASPTPSFELEVILDVRDELSRGREPFSRIMAAVAALRGGEALHLRAPFEPVPLFGVMAKRGFSHTALRHADDDWSVWFFRTPDGAPEMESRIIAPVRATEPVASPQPIPTGDIGTRPEVWIDVRDMEPPEPLVRTLEALETLPAGSVLVQVNVRVPQFLLPILRERGFHFTIDETQLNEVQVRIWRIQ